MSVRESIADILNQPQDVPMDDVGFMALAENAVRYVDERFGRVAAWLFAAAVAGVAIALVGGILVWVLR